MTHGVGFDITEERGKGEPSAHAVASRTGKKRVDTGSPRPRVTDSLSPLPYRGQAHRKADTGCHARPRNATRPLNELPDGVGRPSRASGFGRRVIAFDGAGGSQVLPRPWTPWPKRVIEEAPGLVCQFGPAVAWRRATTRHLLREA